MDKFFEASTKRKLINARQRIDAITTMYDMELSKLSQAELIYADVVNKYRQLLIESATRELYGGRVNEDFVRASQTYAKKEILRYIKERFNIEDIPLENVEIAIKGAMHRSLRVFEIVERYKAAIVDSYVKNNARLWHCSPVSGLTSLNYTIRENQYLNEIVKGVFASSGYYDLTNYIGRAVVGGMIVRDGVVIYPDNPFSRIQHSKTKMELKQPIYMYSVDANGFVPSVCLELQHGTKENGDTLFFPDLRFDDEWTIIKPEVPCECEEITYIPTSHLKEFQVLYRKGKVDLDLGSKSRDEARKQLEKLIKKGKLGYINQERNVNVYFQTNEKNEEVNN